MKKNVYILTEQGNEYSKEGLLYLTDKIEKLSEEKQELIFNMGAVYNDIRKFSETLKQNIADGNHPYIVISHDAINIIYDDNINAMIRALDDFVSKNINTTSWQIAMNVFVNK